MSQTSWPHMQPVLDPLQGCDEAQTYYERGDLSPQEKFVTLMHVLDSREHQPACPAHDPNYADKLKSDLGINRLPDE